MATSSNFKLEEAMSKVNLVDTTPKFNLEQFVMARMVCSGCREELRIPIRQCLRGHHLCEYCNVNCLSCPCCGAVKSEARAYVVEKLFCALTFACKWTKYGCTEKNAGAEVENHESRCNFFHMRCPFRFDTNCDYIGRKQDVAVHCRVVHSLSAYTGNRIQILETQHFRNLNLKPEEFHRQYFTFYARGELFRCTWEMKGTTAYFSLDIIGQISKQGRKFVYEIGFIRKTNNRIALTLKGECAHLPDDRFHFTGNYVSARIENLKRFCSSYGALYFTVKINEIIDGQPAPLDELDWTLELQE